MATGYSPRPSQLPMTLWIRPAWGAKPECGVSVRPVLVKCPTCCPATVAISRFTTSLPTPRRRHPGPDVDQISVTDAATNGSGRWPRCPLQVSVDHGVRERRRYRSQFLPATHDRYEASTDTRFCPGWTRAVPGGPPHCVNPPIALRGCSLASGGRDGGSTPGGQRESPGTDPRPSWLTDTSASERRGRHLVELTQRARGTWYSGRCT